MLRVAMRYWMMCAFPVTINRSRLPAVGGGLGRSAPTRPKYAAGKEAATG
jgi:hypothetical protein